MDDIQKSVKENRVSVVWGKEEGGTEKEREREGERGRGRERGEREREREREIEIEILFNPRPQLKEIFGAGTACVVCPVNRILYLDEVGMMIHFS